MKLKILFLFVLCCSSLCATSVKLWNDTVFKLTAEIEAADGTFIGQKIVDPNEQTIWSKDLANTGVTALEQPSVSLTPFRVVWKCEHGGIYSICDGVSAGGMAQASICPGAHYCKSKKEQQEEKCPPCPTCPPCPPCEKKVEPKLEEK